ncbi:MAG: ATP-grasp domain-containing protein [Saprospiraceae bacterium]|nr:ATP-grasp domain-containing protein [Saprospiraceae bacterium]
MWQRLKNTDFIIKLSSWEYWPVYITNIPTILFWLYFSAKSRHPFFFSTVNPEIETGGVFGESKIHILSKFRPDAIPKTLFFQASDTSMSGVTSRMAEEKISFPVVLKPNVGERGFMVEKIGGAAELEKYLTNANVDFILQEYVDFPLELSVLYHRFPKSNQGKITSICIKQNLKVRGDGVSTVEKLIQSKPRAKLQLKRFRKSKNGLLNMVPEFGEDVLLEPIGNHCRGTMFLNGNDFISQKLTDTFDRLAQSLEGIYYGRFDMKCNSFEQLETGTGYRILEFNGVASEPAHIYDPSYSVLKGYRDIFQHWKIIYSIGKIQAKAGVLPMTPKKFYLSLRRYFRYMKLARRHWQHFS